MTTGALRESTYEIWLTVKSVGSFKNVNLVWPELHNYDRSKIIGESVGLRPSRSEVRLESEKVQTRWV